MPTYTFKSKTTGEEWDDEMSHTKLDAYYIEYNCTQIIGATTVISGTGEMRLKTDEGFKDRMREIKKAAGKGTPTNPVTIGDSI